MRPHSLPLVMLGAGLLWFGWFGFNAGSWLGNDDGVGALMFVNTHQPITSFRSSTRWPAPTPSRDPTRSSPSRPSSKTGPACCSCR